MGQDILNPLSRLRVGIFRTFTELWPLLIVLCSAMMGYFIGVSFRRLYKVETIRRILPASSKNHHSSLEQFRLHNISKIYVPTNPPGAERLPPGIIEACSDFYLRGLADDSSKETATEPKYLLTITVGVRQKHIVNKIVSKFSKNFSVVLFHYDGRTSEWDEFEWSKQAIHISVVKQTKWWYAKRFLHPDIIAPYEYIFIWDEDLGVEHFNAEEYIMLVKKHGLEISQPGIVSKKGLTWKLTKKRNNVEVHKEAKETRKQCPNPHMPPCAGFVEIMAPVFSRDSWRCVWQMIQNDLVHGWGLDFAMWRCVERPHEKMGVVDAQWIQHMVLPSLGNQGESTDGRKPWEGVRARCIAEWKQFEARMREAELKHLRST